MKNELSAAISGIMLLALVACNSNNTGSATATNSKDTTKVSVSANIDTATLPSLLEIGATIKNSGLTYIPGLTNSISDASLYNTAFEQDINLGIYLADLSYCTLNKQNQQATLYLKAVKTIADAIGIGQVFGSNNFSQRYQSNLDNEDSLTAIVADLQTKTDELLKANLQNSMRVVIYSGAWIENMYIGAKVNAQADNTNANFQVIEQMNLLDNILKTLNNYKSSDPHLQTLYTDLKQVADSYHSFDEVKKYNPKQPFALTDDHVKKITGMLETLHSKYIKQ